MSIIDELIYINYSFNRDRGMTHDQLAKCFTNLTGLELAQLRWRYDDEQSERQAAKLRELAGTCELPAETVAGMNADEARLNQKLGRSGVRYSGD